MDNTIQLNYSITPKDASYYDVTWESSNLNIATVDSNGVVTPVKPGTTNIIVKSVDQPSITDKCVVTVTGKTPNYIIAANFTKEIQPNKLYSFELVTSTGEKIYNGLLLKFNISKRNNEDNVQCGRYVANLGFYLEQSSENPFIFNYKVTSDNKDECHIYITYDNHNMIDLVTKQGA